jgi:16S rRNA (uracil1498-N3)-methyltransferase
LKEEEKREKRRKRRKKENPLAMDRIVLDQKINIGNELQIKGPPLEAFRFQGCRVGCLVTVTDSGGNDFRGRVLRLSETEASVFIFDAFPSPTESSLEIILLQALPEKERMELIIQKATELGVSAILPFQSERSISLKERETKQKKAHRWQSIAVKAVQQSRRARVPWVGECRSFLETLEECKGEGLKILLWEKKGENLRDVLKKYFLLNPPFEKGGEEGFETYHPSKVYVMVGPEGGLTQEEVNLANADGFVPIKLGQRILRTETAAIAIVGIIQYELGDLS